MKKGIFGLLLLVMLPFAVYAAPVFTLTETTTPPTTITPGQTVNAVYQVTNNASFTLTNNGMQPLTNVSLTAADTNPCGTGVFSLAAHASCNLKLVITGTVQSGPVVCHTSSKQAVCSQPTPSNRLSVTQVNDSGNSLTAAVNEEAADQHLYYKAITLTNANSSEGTAEIGFDENNVDYLTLCTGASDANCGDRPPSTMSVCEITDNEVTLESGAECIIWVKAKPTGNLTVPTELTNAVHVTSGGNDYSFNVDYALSLYAGGAFSQINGISVAGVAQWEGGATAWSALSSGISGAGNELFAFTTYQGDLYAGGDFTSAGGTSANRIAKWNGSSWSALGAGLDTGRVNALASNDDNLYAGGTFSAAASTSGTRLIAQWNGEMWSALGQGFQAGGGNTAVNALATTPDSFLVYVGGEFTQARDPDGTPVNTNNVASWNTDNSTWTEQGSGGLNNVVYALLYDRFAGVLYAGGAFTSPNRTAAYSGGASWSVLLGGIGNNAVRALTAINDGATFFAGGAFTVPATGIAAQNMAIWGNATGNLGGTGQTYALTQNNNILYVGGDFTSVGSGAVTTADIAQWDNANTTWSATPAGGLGVVGSRVNALIVSPSLVISEAS